MALVVATAYPLQAGRRWSSPIFTPPAYLNRDAREWIDIAEARPFLKEALPMRLGRPLYPAPAFLARRSTNVKLSTVSIYRIVNICWLAFALWGLRRWTLLWTPDTGAALAAGLLLATSPFVQIYLWQPLPEMLGAATAVWPMLWVAWASGWRPGRARPTTGTLKFRLARWLIAGALTAVLMLGKENYALYVALFLMGLWRGAWKPMLAFAAAALAVHGLYILWVVFGLGRSFTPYGANAHGFLTWISQDLLHRTPAEQGHYLARLAGRVGWRALQAFEFWPFALMLGGGFALWHRPRVWDCLAYAAGWFALFVSINIVTPRICYMLYPAILPAAGAAISTLAHRLDVEWGGGARRLWLAGVGAVMLAGALVDPYRLFYYG